MRQQNLLPSKPEWYDRDPAVKASRYTANNLGQHALTVRWSYTTPSNKLGMVQSAMAAAVLRTAPGGNCDVYAEILILPATGGSGAVVRVLPKPAVVGAGEHLAVGPLAVLRSGDAIYAASYNGAPGSGVDYELSMITTEYNAQ